MYPQNFPPTSFCSFLKVVIWSAMEVPSSATDWNSHHHTASTPNNPFGSFTSHKLFQSAADVVIPVVWTRSSDQMVSLMSLKHSLSSATHLEIAFFSSSVSLAACIVVPHQIFGNPHPMWMFPAPCECSLPYVNVPRPVLGFPVEPVSPTKLNQTTWNWYQ